MSRTNRTALHIAAVIPAFNEAATIRAVVSGTLQRIEQVIVVDDGSRDGTAEQLAALPVTVLVNAQNMGKANSLWRGIQHALAAGADAVLSLDADGQHLPEEIPKLIEAFLADPQRLVIGARQINADKAPRLRLFANRFADFWISWAAGQRLRDTQSGFRIYPAHLFSGLELRHERGRCFVLESEILIEAARRDWRSQSVTINSVYPKNARASYYRPAIDTLKITRMVAWKLIAGGMNLTGLLRALRRIPMRS